jgi:hypothetical protein
MTTWEWIVVVVAVAVALLLVLALVRIRRRRAYLKEQFGPEYSRAVSDVGTGDAERRLGEIEQTRKELDLRPLPTAARERYLDEWRQTESRFVNDPRDSARAAEGLVLRALEEQGYPHEDDSERLVALVAVDHPDVADRYRHGHAMLENVDGEQGTENLRKAMLDFRSVLEDVVQGAPTAA